MENGRLEPKAEGESRLIGTISLATVPALKQSGVDWLRHGPGRCRIDLAAARFEGSAGVVLLVAWLRAAREFGKELTYLNAPALLVRIAEVCGTAEMLGFAPTADAVAPVEGERA